MFIRWILYICAFGSLVACSSSTPWHNILGSTNGWNSESVQVHLDAQIGKLRVRHVTIPSKDCTSGRSDHLEISGEIGPDSTASIGRLLPKLAECRNSVGTKIVNRVYLNSGGGRLADGYKLGELFRSRDVQTVVTAGQKCASACAIAFLGGRFRTMNYDALLSFHAPYLSSGIAIDCSDRGQVEELKNYYVKFLNRSDGEFLFERTMSYCSASSGWDINKDASRLFGITTE